MKYYSLKILLIGLLFLNGCENDPKPCNLDERQDLPTQVLQHVHFKNIDLNLGEKRQIIISNQDEFDKYIESYDEPQNIDFSQNVLIGGTIKWKQCIRLQDQFFQSGCGYLYYRVILNEGDCYAQTTLSFLILVDKESLPAKLNFEFIVNQ